MLPPPLLLSLLLLLPPLLPLLLPLLPHPGLPSLVACERESRLSAARAQVAYDSEAATLKLTKLQRYFDSTLVEHVVTVHGFDGMAAAAAAEAAGAAAGTAGGAVSGSVAAAAAAGGGGGGGSGGVRRSVSTFRPPELPREVMVSVMDVGPVCSSINRRVAIGWGCVGWVVSLQQQQQQAPQCIKCTLACCSDQHECESHLLHAPRHTPALVYQPVLVLACCDTLCQLRLDSYRRSTSLHLTRPLQATSTPHTSCRSIWYAGSPN